jgi:RNA polymerase sigma-70 factor (ECF subfamily)
MERNKFNYLAKKIQKGDLKSFRLAFDELYPDLCTNTNRIIYDFEVCRDLIQDIFIKIWDKRESLSNVTDFKSYVYKIAKNRALNYLQAKHLRDNYSALLFKTETEVYDQQKEIEAEELAKMIDLGIDNLPEMTQIIFRLNKIELKKQSEIAETLGVSIKTIEWHIANARREIKKIIKNYISD